MTINQISQLILIQILAQKRKTMKPIIIILMTTIVLMAALTMMNRILKIILAKTRTRSTLKTMVRLTMNKIKQIQILMVTFSMTARNTSECLFG